jgi:hypothetical protein
MFFYIAILPTRQFPGRDAIVKRLPLRGGESSAFYPTLMRIYHHKYTGGCKHHTTIDLQNQAPFISRSYDTWHDPEQTVKAPSSSGLK